jgi:hypothetical protein
MYEDINIDELLAELAARNLPVCFKAIYVIGALRGKKSVIPAVVEAPVEAPARLSTLPRQPPMPNWLIDHPELAGLVFVATIGCVVLAGVGMILLGAMLDGAARAKRIGRPRVRTVLRHD